MIEDQFLHAPQTLEVRSGSGSSGVLPMRGSTRPHLNRRPANDENANNNQLMDGFRKIKPELAGNYETGEVWHRPQLIFRGNMVRIESLPDDFRNAPLDFNLHQTLVIPDCAKEPSRLAKVVALADGLLQDGERYVFTVQVGDIVLTTRYPKSCVAFPWNGEKVLLVREDEILAKVNL